MLTIQLNGDSIQIPSESLQTVLADFALKTVFAVALNGEFVPREHYSGITLKNGDQLEIVSPMQGG